ncbi:MAG: hypothetical protein ACMG6E_03180 [Candidatus Roizmanbacteria bacterium]
MLRQVLLLVVVDLRREEHKLVLPLVVHAVLGVPVGLLNAQAAPIVVVIQLGWLVVDVLILNVGDGLLVLVRHLIILILRAAPRQRPAQSLPLDHASPLLVITEIVILDHVLYHLRLLLLSRRQQLLVDGTHEDLVILDGRRRIRLEVLEV